MRLTKSLVLGLLIATFIATLSLTPNAATSIDTTYGKLPMSFEKNDGQSRPGVDFIARGSGYSVSLARGEAVLTLKKQGREESSATIRMALDGAGPSQGAGEDQLPGHVNYYVGNDRAKWYPNVHTYAKVRYPGVYPGIDILYYGNQGSLEYDFIVSPGADPGVITLAFTGAAVNIEKNGDLVFATAGGSLSMLRPYIYQDINGARRAVEGSYVKRADGRIGFVVGPYDSDRPLVIDPVLLYSTYLGGIGADGALAIAVDQSGNAYITGQTISAGGDYDAFVAKIDASGSSLQYVSYFAGSGEDYGTGIAVDASGTAYVAGRTRSSNFVTTSGAFQTSYNGDGDAFVTKFRSDGLLLYSTYLGGSGFDAAYAIAIDASGNAYVTGHFYTSNFPTTLGAYQTATNGAYDAFVAKLNPSGSALVYSTYLGGNGDDGGLGIAVDSLGNAHVTGSTNSNTFPVLNAVQGTFGGDYDAFVTKLRPDGSALIYSTYLGGSLREFGRGIAVDSLSNAYIAGQTSSSNFPTTSGAHQTTHGGEYDAFAVKINPSGSTFVYSTYLGGPKTDAANAIAVDSAGNAYVTGNNYEGEFPLKDELQSVYHAYSFEGVLAKFAPDGALMYSTYLGGASNDVALGIAVDLLGRAYIAGSTQSTDFPITPGTLQASNGGWYDSFVVKIDAASIGKITGGGSITVPGNIGSFGFTVKRAAPGAPIQGDLQYVNHATGAKVKSVTFSSLSIAATTATFSGTCLNNGVPCTFTVDVSDNGEPGDTDTFSISVSGGATEGGTLRSGNIQIH